MTMPSAELKTSRLADGDQTGVSWAPPSVRRETAPVSERMT
jgi:hypothetical protein